MALYDVNPTELIIKAADKLKDVKEIQPPEWAEYVRTGHGRDRPPVQENWWHIRTAAVLRKLAAKGPIGVSKLRVAYGNRKNNGMAPEHFAKASGNIIRKILQQLEKAGLAKQVEKENRKGRIATPAGISILDKTAAEILKENPPVKLEIHTVTKKNKEEKKNNKKDSKEAEEAEKTENES